MRKQKMQIIVAAGLLLLVTAAYAGMRYYNSRPVEEEVEESYIITQDAADNVTQFSFTNENGSFTFVKTGETWSCKEAPEMSVDTAVLEGMIEKAVSAIGDNQIESVQDMTQYGLTQPEITVSYQTPEGSKTLKIGDYNATVYKYYLGVEGSDTVYTVDSLFRTTFTKSLEDIELVVAEEETAE